MHPFVVLGASFALALLMTPLVRNLCHRWKLYDIPANDPLKIHRTPIPRLGGVAIMLSVFGGASLSLIGLKGGTFPMIALSLSGWLIFLLGAVDDVIGVRPSYRLAGQVGGAGVLIGMGDLFPFSADAPLFVLPLTLLCILVAINAMNLVDGLDGLASGVAAVASAGFLVLAVIQGDPVSQVIALATLGSSLGFLPYNFNPASIFLGDCGSTFLGLYLGTIMAKLIFGAHDSASAIAPVLVMIVPLFDTSFAIGRRLIQRRPLFAGDRNHFYDWLMQRGLTQRDTVTVCYGLGALGAWAAVMVAR